MRIARTVTFAAAGLTLIAALAACGGGVEGSAQAAANSIQAAISANQGTEGVRDNGGTEESSEPAADTSEADVSTDAAAAPITRTIGKTGWYDGFAITVDEVTAEQGFGDGVDITVSFSYQNLGTENDSPPNADVQVDGQSQDGFFDSPGIPGGGQAKGTAVFSVSPEKASETITFDEAIDKVTLVYGDAADNQTSIPLAESGQVDSVEPTVLTATGSLSQGQINVEVVSGTLTPSYESGEKGDALLNLRIKLTCAAGCQAQGYNTGVEEFSITGPDGTSVLADSRSDYCCDALYPETVSDSERNILTFVVPMPGTGAYKLTYTNPYLTSTGVAPGTFDFTA